MGGSGVSDSSSLGERASSSKEEEDEDWGRLNSGSSLILEICFLRWGFAPREELKALYN